jgi:hypothetical protein
MLEHGVHITAQNHVRLADTATLQLAAIDPRAYGLARDTKLRRDLRDRENVIVSHQLVTRIATVTIREQPSKHSPRRNLGMSRRPPRPTRDARPTALAALHGAVKPRDQRRQLAGDLARVLERETGTLTVIR